MKVIRSWTLRLQARETNEGCRLLRKANSSLLNYFTAKKDWFKIFLSSLYCKKSIKISENLVYSKRTKPVEPSVGSQLIESKNMESTQFKCVEFCNTNKNCDWLIAEEIQSGGERYSTCKISLERYLELIIEVLLLFDIELYQLILHLSRNTLVKFILDAIFINLWKTKRLYTHTDGIEDDQSNNISLKPIFQKSKKNWPKKDLLFMWTNAMIR